MNRTAPANIIVVACMYSRPAFTLTVYSQSALRKFISAMTSFLFVARMGGFGVHKVTDFQLLL